MQFDKPKSIFITGASKGLGQALAIAYSMDGVKLFLTGRDEAGLEETKKLCEKLGAKVICLIADVTDEKQMCDMIRNTVLHHNIDLVIANAGISAGTFDGAESSQQTLAVMHTNVMGVIHSILPFLPHFREKKSGQIAIISSLAGLRGMPSCPSYAASKNAVRAYGEGIRGDLHADNVGVTVICPGYIKTAMTDVNNFKMPFIMSAEKAASIIKRKLTKNPARIAFPFALYFPVWLLAAFPPRFTDWIFFKLPKK